ncbi:MAG: hypothetical protein U1C46_11380 [Bacteroidales bacterium]|nr:hypothetical protein [Bacteroidales bacterium]MDZ4205403.1 hypothetical protein [Bacteroidales bacterium]
MEKNIIVRLFKIISVIIILAGVVFVALVWLNSSKALNENLGLQNMILNPFFAVGYIALGICLLLAFLFPIISIISNPKSLLKALIGLAIIVGLGLLIYTLSSNEFSSLQLQEFKIAETTSRQIGAALFGTYAIGAVAILVIFYAEISSFFKT